MTSSKTETVGHIIRVSLLVGLSVAASVEAIADHHQMVATELSEVKTGILNGKEYLTIRITGDVGPVTCRGNTLKVDTATLPRIDGHTEIETVALSAMLNAEVVMITVPMASTGCVDGKPTLTDMYVVPGSP